MRLHEDIARGRIDRETVGHEQVTHEGQEDHKEGHRLNGQAATTSGAHLLVADVVDEIKQRCIDKGMKTLNQTATELVLSGITSVSEMLKVTYSID